MVKKLPSAGIVAVRSGGGQCRGCEFSTTNCSSTTYRRSSDSVLGSFLRSLEHSSMRMLDGIVFPGNIISTLGGPRREQPCREPQENSRAENRHRGFEPEVRHVSSFIPAFWFFGQGSDRLGVARWSGGYVAVSFASSFWSSSFGLDSLTVVTKAAIPRETDYPNTQRLLGFS